jgi:hypothetical protein
METLSFVLGIAFVVVIAVAAVATYAFFKVLKTKNELEDLNRQLDVSVSGIYQTIHSEDITVHRRIDELEKEVFSQLDSRLDKLENKLTTKK